MIKISPEQLTTSPRSDKLGSLWSSFNLDLQTNKGHIRVSPRSIITTDDLTDLDVAAAFTVFTDTNAGAQYFWAVSGKYIWRVATTDGYITAFAKDASTGTPDGASAANSMNSDSSDLVYYGKTFMVASGNTSLFCYTASTGQWTNPTGSPNLTQSTSHPMCVYGDRFYVVDESTKIRSMTTAFGTPTTSGANFLSLANKGWNVTSISTIRANSSRIWVGTINQNEDGCWVFAWDGATATDPNEAYFIPDVSGIMAMIIQNDNPWVLDNNARLMYFNGGTFVEAQNGRLPVKNAKFLKNSLSSINDRWIHPNGIEIVDGKIRILINNEHEDNGATVEENIASGVWEYDPQIGWLHIMSLSLYTSSVTDYGQNRVSRVGALYAAKNEGTAATANGTMLLGAQLYSDAATTKEVIAIDDSNDTLQKYGYFVTSKIYSQNIQDTWQAVYARFKKLLNSADSITIKYRTNDEDATEITITWTATNTFTTTTNIMAYHPNTLGFNPEVEVIQGKGSGKCAHITDISHSGGTYTVTLDDTFTGASSGTAKARFQKWIKAGVCTDQTVKFFKFPLGIPDTFIQLKVAMQFTGKDELDDIILESKPHQLAQ